MADAPLSILIAEDEMLMACELQFIVRRWAADDAMTA
jgi:hypothetical protein